MSKSDYNYLRSLPLVLHLPSEHAFLAHGGLLPYDPTHPISSKRQPLAHLPKLPSAFVGDSVATLRNAQELAILNDIKQNNDPWAVLNIRNLRNDNTVSRWVVITPSLTHLPNPHLGAIGKKARVDLGLTSGMERCRGVQDLSHPRRSGEIPFLATHRRWSMATRPLVAWTYTGGPWV